MFTWAAATAVVTWTDIPTTTSALTRRGRVQACIHGTDTRYLHHTSPALSCGITAAPHHKRTRREGERGERGPESGEECRQ